MHSIYIILDMVPWSSLSSLSLDNINFNQVELKIIHQESHQFQTKKLNRWIDSHICCVSIFIRPTSDCNQLNHQKQKWNSSSLSHFFSFSLSPYPFHNISIVLLVSRVMFYIYILEYKLIGDEYPKKSFLNSHFTDFLIHIAVNIFSCKKYQVWKFNRSINQLLNIPQNSTSN